MFDLELEKRTAPGTVFTGVKEVFTPALNTLKEDEIVNIIEYSGDEPDGDSVISANRGGEENSFENAQEGPGNGHGNGDLNLDPGNGHGNGKGVDLDEQTKKLAEEFAPFMNPKTILTPHL